MAGAAVFGGLSLIGCGNSLHSTSLALNIPNPGNYSLSYLIGSGDEQKMPSGDAAEYLRAYPLSSPLCVYLLGTAIHRGGSRPEVYKSCLQFLPPTNVNNASSSAGRPPPAHHEQLLPELNCFPARVALNQLGRKRSRCHAAPPS